MKWWINICIPSADFVACFKVEQFNQLKRGSVFWDSSSSSSLFSVIFEALQLSVIKSWWLLYFQKNRCLIDLLILRTLIRGDYFLVQRFILDVSLPQSSLDPHNLELSPCKRASFTIWLIYWTVLVLGSVFFLALQFVALQLLVFFFIYGIQVVAGTLTWGCSQVTLLTFHNSPATLHHWGEDSLSVVLF